MKLFEATLVIVAAAVVVVPAVLFGVRLNQSVQLAKQSRSFEAHPQPAGKRLLIIGDSTGVGTGAQESRNSIAGRTTQNFPDVEIVNRSTDGAKVADMIGQLERSAAERFDLILIQGGGNDVLRLTSMDKLAGQMQQLGGAAAGHAAQVIFMPSGNVGTAPIFFPPFSWLLSKRARAFRALVMEAAERNGAIFVDLFYEAQDDPFLKNPQRFYAADYLHPSDDGYELWYRALERQANLPALLR